MIVTTDLVHIQSPDFQPGRVEPPPPPNPNGLILVMSAASAAAAAESSLGAPHLKQLERLAKLWAPQFPTVQYQSPGRTSGPVVKEKEGEPLPPPKAAP